MQPAIFSAGTGFTDIAMREADAEAVKLGACEVAEYMVPSRLPYYQGTRFEPMFRYYFLVDGTELGYFTYPLGILLIHNKPRIWDAGYKAALMKDKFHNLDDGYLALGTPEREDQEKRFGEGQEPDEELPAFLKKQAD